MAFVHLHVHSQYSLLDGTATVMALATRAAQLGMGALALTDTANMYGAVAFFKACEGAGVKPILGAELHVQPEGVDHADPARSEGGYQLIALVEDARGYQNLCRLVTAAIFDGMSYKPRVDPALIRAHSEGLIFLTGGTKGVLGRALQAGERELADQRLEQLQAFLGPEQLYLELQDLGLPGQEELNALTRGAALRTGYHTVVTNAVHYLEPEDAAVHEVLNAIGSGTSMSDPGRLLCDTDQAWLKPDTAMRELFPGDEEAVSRTAEIAARCDFRFELGVYHFPATTPPDIAPDGTQQDTEPNWAYFYRAFPPPQDFGLPDPSMAVPEKPDGAGDINGYFAWYAKEGLALRLQRIPTEQHQEYYARLEYEVKVVVEMGFPAYLLIVAEFINWSKDNGIPVGPGRGSAAGSIAAWGMRITDIDPIRYGLLFERFLNPARVSMPDIDVDFCQDRREEAIEHVRAKYGEDLVSQIITYGTLKAKAAVRDVARVLDLNFQEGARIAQLVPDQLGITLTEALAQEPRLRDLREGDPKVRRVLDLALAIEGTNRQTGVHAAGVVIADRPLVEYAPLYRDEPEGGPVVQFDMKSAEDIGLIKFDFLGLKTLDQIRDAVLMVEANHGVQIDMSDIPEDDAATYALLQQGDALGVFQLESSGMRDLLTRLKPSDMNDMVALVALYRPGPLQSGMTDDYVDRKHDKSLVDYPLLVLKPILEETYGTIIYQEQVMQIAQVMAGYSLGEADLLRRAMGKKKKEEMDKQRSRFITGSVDNGIDEEVASDIFELMAKFAAYGFNKSHSAAYGYIAYQTAYLKAHYRPEFMAALMTIESANTDKILAYILDCRRAGIEVLPACVNASAAQFGVPTPKLGAGQVRFGLGAIRNVGSGAVEALIEAREAAGGAFASVADLLERIDHRRVNRRVFEHLIKAGALDFDGTPRSALLEGLEAAMSTALRTQQDKAAGQIGLFAAAATGPREFRFPDLAEWPLSQRLACEREVLGLYLSGHPMQAHDHDVQRYSCVPLGGLNKAQESDEVRLLALAVDVRVVRTRRNDKMAFVQLEDANASLECVFFADAWSRSQQAVVDSGEPLLVKGKVEVSGEEIKFLARSAERLTEVRARRTSEVCFRLDLAELRGGRLEAFRSLLEAERGGCKSKLVVRVDGRFEAELELPQLPVSPSTHMEESVHTLFGRSGVVALS